MTVGKTLREMTPPQALELLRKQRDAKGADYVYRPEQVVKGRRAGTCDYLEPDDSGSCIVGCALLDVGVTPDEIKGAILEWRLINGGTNTQPAAWQLCEILGLPVRVSNVFQVAQEMQDDGKTWGTAVDEAEAAYEGLLEPRLISQHIRRF